MRYNMEVSHPTLKLNIPILVQFYLENNLNKCHGDHTSKCVALVYFDAVLRQVSR